MQKLILLIIFLGLSSCNFFKNEINLACELDYDNTKNERAFQSFTLHLDKSDIGSEEKTKSYIVYQRGGHSFKRFLATNSGQTDDCDSCFEENSDTYKLMFFNYCGFNPETNDSIPCHIDDQTFFLTIDKKSLKTSYSKGFSNNANYSCIKISGKDQI